MPTPLTTKRQQRRFGLMVSNAFDRLSVESNLALSQTAACCVVYSRSSNSHIAFETRAGPEIFERATESFLSLSQSSIAKREANSNAINNLSLSQEVNVSGGQQGVGSSITFNEEEFPVTSAIEISKEVTLSSTPITNSEFVYLNGVHLKRGSTRDYTLSGTVITFNAAWVLKVDDIITVRYVT